MVTLSISCSIILLFTNTYQDTLHAVRGQLFVLQFESTLKHQQAQAITRAETRSLSATDHVVKMNGQVLDTPKETLFSDFNITFKENGNIKSIKSAKIIITLPYEGNKQVIYQLQLGSGQYKKTTS
ncbi:competence protein ComGD [Lactococcus piscium]|uniref:Competence protein ComGD n=1 Tax=Pseudolactococcus piscium TaxID=1364 RepID=A0A2A5RWP7_9LACT|nr:competence protein ComGD [Lactococcus piscium]